MRNPEQECALESRERRVCLAVGGGLPIDKYKNANHRAAQRMHKEPQRERIHLDFFYYRAYSLAINE
jgi:hypothetical protein